MIAEIAEAARGGSLILFVGSGVSNALSLPTWGGLIDHLADDLGFDPDLFRGFGADWTLAEYYKLVKGSVGPLRAWMEENWHHGKQDNLEQSSIHRLIYALDFQLIYTTNYDHWLERYYDLRDRKYLKIASVEDLARASAQPALPQIVKFHGDLIDDASLVLTETDYLRRMTLDSPLDVRLRSDTLGRPVLFIGYSLSDPNVRLLLYKLRGAWEAAGSAVRQPRSYLFVPRPNPIQARVLDSWGVTAIPGDADSPQEALIHFLEQLKVAKEASPLAEPGDAGPGAQPGPSGPEAASGVPNA